MTFGFKNVGHFFATTFRDIEKGVKYVAAHETQIESGAGVALDTVAIAAKVVDPAASAVIDGIDQGGKYALGKFFAAVDGADAATKANGLNVALNAEEITSVEQLLKSIEALKPGSTVVPAYLKTAPVAVPAAA